MELYQNTMPQGKTCGRGKKERKQKKDEKESNKRSLTMIII